MSTSKRRKKGERILSEPSEQKVPHSQVPSEREIGRDNALSNKVPPPLKYRASGIQAAHVWMVLFSIVLSTATFFVGRAIQLGQATQEFRNDLKQLSETNAQLIQQKARDVTREELRIDQAIHSIDMMGTTNARRLHLLRDPLVRAINRGVVVRILFLDPRSEYFQRYEDKEQDQVGRLRFELATGIATLRDVWTHCDIEARGRLIVRTYQATPEFALSGFDVDDPEHGELDINEYPTEKGKRGIYGPLAIFTSGTPFYSAGYDKYYKKYWSLWESSTSRQVKLDHRSPTLDEIRLVSNKAVGE